MPDISLLDGVYSRVLLALCAWREARDQGIDGMRAVCWSVRNRVATKPPHWWGDSYPSVILHSWQYSSFNVGDPNATKFPGMPSTDAAWRDALIVADEVYFGVAADPTGGATHYYVAATTPPTWAIAPGTVFTVQIGAHRFYKAA